MNILTYIAGSTRTPASDSSGPAERLSGGGKSQIWSSVSLVGRRLSGWRFDISAVRVNKSWEARRESGELKLRLQGGAGEEQVQRGQCQVPIWVNLIKISFNSINLILIFLISTLRYTFKEENP